MTAGGCAPPLAVSPAGSCPGLLFTDLGVDWGCRGTGRNKRKKRQLPGVVTALESQVCVWNHQAGLPPAGSLREATCLSAWGSPDPLMQVLVPWDM